jgi:rRNA maturation protein Rpf1
MVIKQPVLSFSLHNLTLSRRTKQQATINSSHSPALSTEKSARRSVNKVAAKTAKFADAAADLNRVSVLQRIKNFNMANAATKRAPSFYFT